MKKLMVIGASAVGTAAASMALFGTGVAAAAPDVVGQTYHDARRVLADAAWHNTDGPHVGFTPVIAVRVGAKMDDNDCIVTSAWVAPFVRDYDGRFGRSDDQVILALNCEGEYATGTNPGPSVASPAGRAAKAAADEAAAAKQAERAAVSTPDE